MKTKRNNALAVQFIAMGFKCDSPGCGYQEPAGSIIPVKEIEGMVGKPCPKCGANLLTVKDYNVLKGLLAVLAVINFLFLPLQLLRWILFRLKLKHLPRDETIRVHLDGTGKLTATRIEKDQ